MPGIDGYIELRDGATGEVTNNIIQVQSKATDNPFEGETPEKFEYLVRWDKPRRPQHYLYESQKGLSKMVHSTVKYSVSPFTISRLPYVIQAVRMIRMLSENGTSRTTRLVSCVFTLSVLVGQLMMLRCGVLAALRSAGASMSVGQPQHAPNTLSFAIWSRLWFLISGIAQATVSACLSVHKRSIVTAVCLIVHSAIICAQPDDQAVSRVPFDLAAMYPLPTVNDSTMTWAADFTGDQRAEVLGFGRVSGTWWLWTYNGTRLNRQEVGNSLGFGNLNDGRPLWVKDFNGDGKSDVLFYYPGDQNWWLGTIAGNQLTWSLIGNTAGFGQVWDGRPFWSGDFNGDGTSDVLFYYPGDQNWWLGTIAGNQLTWSLIGNTAGFGQVWDGRPFWTGNFVGSPSGQSDILFYYPDHQNWWVGTVAGNQLTWSLSGNTAGFGQVWDGRPFWAAHFDGGVAGQSDILFYYPAHQNWWLGNFSGSQLNWSLVGSTAGFGQVWDGRPFWTADFDGDGRKDLLFRAHPDHWWLGSMTGNQLVWKLIREPVPLWFPVPDPPVEPPPDPLPAPINGKTGVGMTQNGGSLSFNYSGITPDPLAWTNAPKKHAVITEIKNITPHTYSIAHVDRLGSKTFFVVLSPGQVSTWPFTGREVEGSWTAQLYGLVADAPSALTLEISWKAP